MKNPTLKSILLACLCFAFYFTNAQHPSSDLVNPYNGQINVNIPLGTIVDGDIAVPIVLSYNSSGLAADQWTGYTGVGWNLPLGGSITRVIRGKDDFQSNRDVLDLTNNSAFFISTTGVINGSSPNINLQEIINGTGTDDAEYDIFSATFNGFSAKFIIDNAGNIVKLTPNDFTIKKISSTEFSIATNTGIVYYFGGDNATLQNPTPSVNYYQTSTANYDFQYSSLPELKHVHYNNAVTAWYLKNIKSATGHQVNFNYAQSPNTDTVEIGGNGLAIEDFYVVTSVGCALTSISTNKGGVNLVTGFCGNPTQNLHLIPRSTLRQLNFYGISSNKYSFEYNCSSRVWLQSIKRNGNLFYDLNYTSYPAYNQLPENHHGDAFGYYNGGVNNRNPNPNNAVNDGLLQVMLNEQLQSTQFEYELNDYLDANNLTQQKGGVRVKSVTTADSYIAALGTKKYKTIYDYTNPATGLSSGKLMTYPDYLFYFSLSTSYVSFSINSLNHNPSAQGSYVGYDYVKVTQVDPANNNNGYVLNNFYNDADILSPEIAINNATLNQICSPVTTDFSLTNGTLKSQKVFNKNNVLVSETNNSYSTLNNPPIHGLQFGGSVGNASPPLFDNISYSVYDINTSWLKLESTTSTNYDINGNNPISNTTNYFYNSTFQNTVEHTQQFNSDGSEINSYSKFACSPDFANGICINTNPNVCAIAAFRTASNPPITPSSAPLTLIESYSTIKTPGSAAELATSGQLNLYAENPIGSGHYMLATQKSLMIAEPVAFSASSINTTDFINDSHYQTVREILQRDNNGVVMKAGLPAANNTTRMYDMNGINVIADVVNAKVDEKANFVGNEFGYCGYELRNNVSSIGSSPNAQYVIGNWTNFEIGGWGSYANPTLTNLEIGFAHTGSSSFKLEPPLSTSNNNYGDKSFYKIFEPDNQLQKYSFSAWVNTVQFKNSDGEPILPGSSSRIVGEIVAEFYDPTNLPNPLVVKYSSPIYGTDGKWVKVEKIIDFAVVNSATKLQIKCYIITKIDGTAYTSADTLHLWVDDMRFQPVNAFATTYNYNDFNQVTSTLDFYNEPVGYVDYDNKARVIKTYDLDKKVVSYNNYHLSDQTISPDDLSYVESFNLNNLGTFNQSRTYHDFQGKPLQSVAIVASPLGFNIIQPYAYDDFGRSIKNYLPYTSNTVNPDFQTNAIADQAAVYTNGMQGLEPTANPFAQTVVETSPLNRTIEQGSVGDQWQPGSGHTNTGITTTNGSNEVKLWTYYKTTNTGAVANSEYPANSLYKNTVTDANGKTSITYTDKSGKLICTTTTIHVNANGQTTDGSNGIGDPNQSGTTQTLYSYNVYNDLGQLVYTIAPKAYQALVNSYTLHFNEEAGGVNNGIFNELIFANHYDDKGRIAAKKEPGKTGWQYFVYNRINQLIMSQDPVQAANNKYTYIKYDNLGRVIITGVLTHGSSPEAWQDVANNNLAAPWETVNTAHTTNIDYYTLAAVPDVSGEILTINFYDDYNFYHSASFDFNTAATTVPNTLKTKGLLTGSVVKVLDNNNNYLLSVNYYDRKKRLLQNFKANHKGGFDQSTLTYNLIGQVINTDRKHFYSTAAVTANSALVIKNRFDYDSNNRLLAMYQQTGNDPEIQLSRLNYNELGTPFRKQLHSNLLNPSGILQSIDYTYNVKGWLTRINNASLVPDAANPDDDDVFGEEINYTSDLTFDNNKNALPFYDGTISSIRWKTKSPQTDPTTVSEQAYIYRYDDLNRMTAAYYAATSPEQLAVGFNADYDAYNEIVNYDIAGNITNLNRNDAKVNHTQLIVDQLNYTYFDNSNRIQKIEDASQFDTNKDVKHFYDITNTAATDFTYDNNANIVNDENKTIATTYNFLNLPQTVSKDVNNVSKTIDYLYDATGNKLQTIEGTTTTDYINGIQYTNSNLTAIATAEGRVRPKSYFANNTTAFVYDYYIKDHLGNVRVTITEEDNRDYYMATMEAQNDATESVLFDNVPQTRYDIPYTYPPDSTYTPNASISRLNGQDSTTIGHAKILQVREGDNLTFDAKYFYHDSTVAYNPSPVSTIITQLTGIILGNSLAGDGLTADEANAWITEAFTNGPVNNFLTSTFNQNNTGSPEAPQAYLVYLTFDESFNLIESKSGMLQATEPDELGELAVANLQIEKNGFIYIYVNNQSGYPVNFDNLRIAHKLASVMEVNNYYPYGLLNSSLSYSRSGNRYKYQTKEVDNYFDYNILDFGARHYDAATARWTAYDPASQYATPYISMGGNPVSGIDPDGRKSRQPTDAEASIAAAEQQIAANDNTSSNGFGGGSERYLALARAAGIGLQYGSYSWTYYMDDNGKFYANVEAASSATGISITSINGLSSGEKIIKDFNVEVGPAEKSERGKHLTLNYLIIKQSFDIDNDGFNDFNYGDIEWKLGNVDANFGNEVNGIPENDFLRYSVASISVWSGTVQTGFETAKYIQPAVKTFSTGAKVFGHASNFLGGTSVAYDFFTGTANTSTVLNGVVMVGGFVAIGVLGATAAPGVAAFGVGYGISSLFFEKPLNKAFDISKTINFVKPIK